MSIPFFSVVLPTKNRSFLVGHAIRSVLQQSFPDFELIVVDNDDTDATRKVVETFKDPRLRYLRTGGFSMPDNWEHGSSASRGEYLLVIEDKQMLKPSTLARVLSEISRHKPEVVRWLSDSFDDEFYPPRVRRGKGDGSVRLVSSDALLNLFLNDSRLGYKLTLPLPQLSCIQRQLLEKIKAGPMQRLFHPVSPDVVLAFLQLAYSDAICEIHSPLVFYLSSKHSNGKSVSNKGEAGRQFIRQLPRGRIDCYDHVPVKCVTVPGTIYNDYLRTQERVQGRLARHQLNWTKYFVDCYRALLGPMESGIDMSEEMSEWRRAFGDQPQSIQESVLKELPILGAERPSGVADAFKRIGRTLGLQRWERICKGVYRGRIRKDPEWRFTHAIDYFDWESRQPER